mgnify:CR=1 FL=1|jgi:tRNA (guanine-N7-)-methyltransferase
MPDDLVALGRDEIRKLSEEERRVYFEKRGAPPVTPFEGMPGFGFLLPMDQVQEWEQSLEAPLYLDIGAGMGRFLMGEAEKHPEINYLGIDSDYQCAKRNLQKLSNRERQGQGLDRVRFFYGSVYHFMSAMQRPLIDRAYVNYPDPWFKKRHLKRRLVTEELFGTLRPLLKEGAEVYVQTDIDDYGEFIEEQLEGVKGYDITLKANALFEGLTGTLYQEKAEHKGHQRHCYLLKKS